jgi:hypothetical protein
MEVKIARSGKIWPNQPISMFSLYQYSEEKSTSKADASKKIYKVEA